MIMMEKSAIFKEATQSDPNTESLLKRLKVLTFGLGCEQFNKWIDSELYGYKDEDIPEYRKTRGHLKGDVVIGFNQIRNMDLPITTMDAEVRNNVLVYSFREGLGGIRGLVESKHGIVKPLPPEYYPMIKKGTSIDGILSARVLFNNTCVNEILSTVNNMILDILLELEIRYGNLDKYDLDFSNEEKDNQMRQTIIQILFNNGAVIGNNNDLEKTSIAIDNRGQK